MRTFGEQAEETEATLLSMAELVVLRQERYKLHQEILYISSLVAEVYHLQVLQDTAGWVVGPMQGLELKATPQAAAAEGIQGYFQVPLRLNKLMHCWLPVVVVAERAIATEAVAEVQAEMQEVTEEDLVKAVLNLVEAMQEMETLHLPEPEVLL
jgi:hypothetical protein